MGNSPVADEFPSQRPVTRSFDAFFDLRLSNGWVNNRDAGDLGRYHVHYEITAVTGYNIALHWAIGVSNEWENATSTRAICSVRLFCDF